MGFGRVGVETPTLTPIDRRLAPVDILTPEERDPLNLTRPL